jgi:hypothetical protein
MRILACQQACQLPHRLPRLTGLRHHLGHAAVRHALDDYLQNPAIERPARRLAALFISHLRHEGPEVHRQMLVVIQSPQEVHQVRSRTEWRVVHIAHCRDSAHLPLACDRNGRRV